MTDDMCVLTPTHYCNPKGFWRDEVLVNDVNPFGLSDLTFLARGRVDPQNDAGCCPETYCWDGATCIASQVGDSRASIDGSRCVDGVFLAANERFRWDRAESGFCPESDHCFVGHDLSLNKGSSNACIASEEYVDDYWCKEERGEPERNLWPQHYWNITRMECLFVTNTSVCLIT